MADYMDASFTVTYTRETPAESYKLMNQKHRFMATAYESGERTLNNGISDVKLVDGVTHFYMVSDKPVTLTLSDGKIFENMTELVYGGAESISVTVSNPSTNTAKITYAAGLKSANSC